jgi:hypothetical protein
MEAALFRGGPPMRRLQAAFLLAPVMIAGCMTQPQPVPVARIDAGWNCLAYPTAFRDAGVVYALSVADGSATTFKDFHATPGVQIRSAEFVDLNASHSNKVNASILAQLLGLKLKAQASAGTLYTVSQSFGTATQTDMNEAGDYKLKDAFYAAPELQQAIRYGDASNHKFYLIRNTIRALTVTYSFDRNIEASIDVSAPVHGVSGEVKAGLDNSSGVKYSKTFKTPQDVCLLTEFLPVPRAAPPSSAGMAAARYTAAIAPGLAAGPASLPGDQPLFTSYRP